MRKLSAALAALIALAVLEDHDVFAQGFLPNGYCALSVAGSAVPVSICSGGIPNGTQRALICPETQDIRWRDDGTAPTSSLGMPLYAKQCMTYGVSLGSLQLIAPSGTATTVSIWFGK